jgi:hypothetical protein
MLFAVADAVVFRPFLADAGGSSSPARTSSPSIGIAYRDFPPGARSRTFADMAAIGSSSWTWQRGPPASRQCALPGGVGALLRVDGRKPARPHVSADDDLPGSARTVVLSYGFWQRQFGGDQGFIGRTIVLSERSFTVVGVMPPAFRYPVGADVWTPVVPELAAIASSIPNLPPDGGDVGIFFAVGRLNTGATVEAARLELNGIIARRATTATPPPSSNRASARSSTTSWVPPASACSRCSQRWRSCCSSRARTSPG